MLPKWKFIHPKAPKKEKVLANLFTLLISFLFICYAHRQLNVYGYASEGIGLKLGSLETADPVKNCFM